MLENLKVENVNLTEQKNLQNNTNMKKTTIIVLSVILAIVLCIIFVFVFTNKTKENKSEPLTKEENELVGTYKFLNAKYDELYLGEMITCYYPNGPEKFNEATEQYLDAEIQLIAEKKDGQISGALILSSARYDFKWTRFSERSIHLDGDLRFACGNDVSLYTDSTNVIFIADDYSYINVVLMNGNYTIFYYFEKV